MNRISKRMAATCGGVMVSAMFAARGVSAAADSWSQRSLLSHRTSTSIKTVR